MIRLEDIKPGLPLIRRARIEAALVACMVALPGQLFYRTQNPVCLWFLAKNKNADARKLGSLDSQPRPTRRSFQASAAFRRRRNFAARHTNSCCRYLSPKSARKPMLG